MRRWKQFKIMILCAAVVVLALIGMTLSKDVCFLDSCPFAPKNSLGIPTTGVEASEVGASYTKLAVLLEHQKSLEADRETVEKILFVTRRESSGKLESEDIKKFPCKDLRTINNLWLTHSGGKYGLTVQKKIYEKIYKELSSQPKKKYDYTESEAFDHFAELVGWISKAQYKSPMERELPLNPHGGEGHLPMTYIKTGVIRCCRLEGGLCLMCIHPLAIAPGIMQDFFSRATSCKI